MADIGGAGEASLETMMSQPAVVPEPAVDAAPEGATSAGATAATDVADTTPEAPTDADEHLNTEGLSESLDAAVAARDVQAAREAGRKHFEGKMGVLGYSAEEIADLESIHHPIIPMIRKAMGLDAEDTTAPQQPDAQAQADADAAMGIGPEAPSSAAPSPDAQPVGDQAPPQPGAEQTPPGQDQQQTLPGAEQAAPPQAEQPPRPAEAAVAQAVAEAPDDEQSALQFLREKLLKLNKKGEEVNELMDQMGVTMVEKWGDEVAAAIENNLDIGAFMDYISTGEFYSKIAHEFGYKGAEELEKEGKVAVGPAQIEAHTFGNASLELSLALTGLVEAGLCSPDDYSKLMKEGKDDPAKILKSDEFKNMINELTRNKGAAHVFSAKVAEICSGKKDSDLTNDGMTYMFMLSMKAESLPHLAEKNKNKGPAQAESAAPVEEPKTAEAPHTN